MGGAGRGGLFLSPPRPPVFFFFKPPTSTPSHSPGIGRATPFVPEGGRGQGEGNGPPSKGGLIFFDRATLTGDRPEKPKRRGDGG